MTHIPEVYYIVSDHGRLGRETTIDWERCSKQNVIETLIAGQIDKPIEVHCIDRDSGRWWDASKEIAQDIVDRLEEEPAGALFDFLEVHLGHRVMADLARQVWGAMA